VSQRLNSLMEHIRRFYSYRGRSMSFDDSFVREVNRYYELISASPRTSSLGELERLFVLAVVTDEAVRTARKRGLNQVNGDLFKAALEPYKGPIQDPDYPCVDAAIRISGQREEKWSQLPQRIREFLESLNE
jgi:hypothetical protein